MKQFSSSQSGFSLVEMAIVLIIIGLLIGGVLIGKDILENGRILSTYRQIASYNAAVNTFRAAYGVLPGDMKNPSDRLSRCTTAKCNVGGNGNAMIGDANAYDTSEENNTFWLHLNAAGLVEDVDRTMTWSSNNIPNTLPRTPLKSNIYIQYTNIAADSFWLQGLYGHQWVLLKIPGPESVIPLPVIAKMDIKYDDGKPWTGKMISGACVGLVSGSNVYPPAADGMCYFYMKAGF